MYPIYHSPEMIGTSHLYRRDFEGLMTHQCPTGQEQPHSSDGGVQPYLDYDVETMSEFLALHLYGLCKLRGSAPPAMRKFVGQILHATRLPLATILLSLVYLQHRVSLPLLGERWLSGLRCDHSATYRVVTTMFVIANKFLDDNTFTNKSWSDVTHIDTRLITALEIDWLRDVAFTLSPETIDGESKHAGWTKLWGEFVYRRLDLARQHAAAAVVASSIFSSPSSTTVSTPAVHGYPTPVTANASPFVDGCVEWAAHEQLVWPQKAHHHLRTFFLPPPHLHRFADDHRHTGLHCSLCHAQMQPIALGF